MTGIEPNSIAAYKCPNCAGILRYDNKVGLLVCAHCKTSFSRDDAVSCQPTNAKSGDTGEKPEKTLTDKEFFASTEWESGAAPVSTKVPLMEYSCPECSACIIAEQSAISLSCPYCSNSLLVSGVASSKSLPDYIVPFKVTKTQALECVEEHIRGKRLVPAGFKLDIKHLKAVYVPFYACDIRAKEWAVYHVLIPEGPEGTTDQTGACYNKSFVVSGDLRAEGLLHDASCKMPDTYMDALNFVPMPEKEKFSPEYYAGYYTEIADEDAQSTEKKMRTKVAAIVRARTTMEACAIAGGVYPQIIEERTQVDVENSYTVSMPVWLLHAVWKGRDMLFAVNGNDGECVGNIVADMRRAKTPRRFIVIACAVAAVAAFFVFAAAVKDIGVYGGLILLILFFVISVAFVIGTIAGGIVFNREERLVAEMDFVDDKRDLQQDWIMQHVQFRSTW